MLVIRKVNDSDKEKYVSLAEKFYSSEAVLHEISKDNFYKTFNEFMLSDIFIDIYLLELNDKAIGYFLLSKTYSQEVGGKVLLIEEIFIESEYRNKGISKKIFNFIFETYSDYKRYRLELTKNNTVALKVYTKLDFEKLEYLQMIKDKI